MIKDQEKQIAARAALQFIHDGDVVGLGSGSTAEYFLQYLAERVKAGLNIQGVPTSERIGHLATIAGIPLLTLEQCQQIDIDVDGADVVDPKLRLIKGGGGALLREKIIATASRQMVVIADSSKARDLSEFPLPVEVISFAQALVAGKIAAMGAKVTLRRANDGQPYMTDERHHILDCKFESIPDPEALAHTLDTMPGVVEHGMFIGIAKIALIGKGAEVIEMRSQNPAT